MIAIYTVWSHASKKYIARGRLNHFVLDTMKRFADDLAGEDNTTFSVEQFEMQMPDAPGKIVYTIGAAT